MDKKFHSKEELKSWLREVLFTDCDDAKYEENQIITKDISVPVVTQECRRKLCDLITEEASPYLDRISYTEYCTHENCDMIKHNLLHYQADGLVDEVMLKDKSYIIFADLSGKKAVHNVLLFENGLDGAVLNVFLDALYKELVVAYYRYVKAPASCIIDGVDRNHVMITNKRTGAITDKVCRDTNPFVYLYQTLLRMFPALQNGKDA
jgi:hypothetical protein